VGKEDEKAQITIPAARTEQEASWRTPQHYEQPRLVSAEGADIEWPAAKTQATHTEISIFLRMAGERKLLLDMDQMQRDQHRQRSRESYNQQKQSDPEGLREKWRVRKAQQRARQKPETQAQQKQAKPT